MATMAPLPLLRHRSPGLGARSPMVCCSGVSNGSGSGTAAPLALVVLGVLAGRQDPGSPARGDPGLTGQGLLADLGDREAPSLDLQLQVAVHVDSQSRHRRAVYV